MSKAHSRGQNVVLGNAGRLCEGIFPAGPVRSLCGPGVGSRYSPSYQVRVLFCSFFSYPAISIFVSQGCETRHLLQTTDVETFHCSLTEQHCCQAYAINDVPADLCQE